jgi:predicted phage terminase large subunit-like protein
VVASARRLPARFFMSDFFGDTGGVGRCRECGTDLSFRRSCSIGLWCGGRFVGDITGAKSINGASHRAVVKTLVKVVSLGKAFRGRLEYPDLRRKVIALAQLHRPATILIEDAGPGMSLLQDLRNSMPAGLIRPLGVRPVGDKLDRMAAQSAKFEAGQVRLAKDAHWHADFLGEMLAFPNGRHDDQVDSVSQLLTWRQNVWMPRQAPIVVPFVYARSRQFLG